MLLKVIGNTALISPHLQLRRRFVRLASHADTYRSSLGGLPLKGMQNFQSNYDVE